jgi:hypothetical protein
MTLMPIIEDRMVALFRRTGKRHTSYRSAQSGRVVAAAQRVVMQRSPGCSFVNQGCITKRGEVGICDGHLNCIVDPFPGDFRI